MKKLRPTFVIAFLFLMGISATAQEAGRRLTGEAKTIGDSVCEIHMSLMDRFLLELSNEPAAQGAIVIYQPGVEGVAVVKRERMLRNFINQRRFDPARITIQRGTPQADAVTQYWIVSPGGEMPKIAPEDPDAPEVKPVRLPPDSGTTAHNPDKPYLFVEYSDVGGVSGCEDEDGVYWEELLAKRLNENPGSRSNIVVKVPTRADLREKEQEIVERMSSFGITKARFRVFHKKTAFERMIELWVLPGKAQVPKLEKPSTLTDDAPRFTALRDVEKSTADINSYPNDPEAYITRARAYLKIDRNTDAIADLTKAIAVSKHPYYVAQATTDRGEVYLARKEYGKAAADFTSVIDLSSAAAYRPRAFLNRAKAQYLEGKNVEAMKDVNEAIALYSAPGRPGAKRQLGEAFAFRSSVNCAAGRAKTAGADAAKARSLGAAVTPCRSR